MDPIEHRVAGAGVELSLFEWPGDGPAIFFAHATGFHARCWDQVVANLPGRHCYSLDLRGHGRSEKPAPPYPWRRFGEDVARVVRDLGLTGAIGVGHSKGGYAVTLAAALAPGAFAALLLVDPVIMPREAYRRMPAGDSGDHFAARRRNEWNAPEEMIERFAGREPFSRWHPAVLADYCRYGLLPNPNGEGYVLACPPQVEAAVYAGASGQDIGDELGMIEIPVRILRAQARQADTRDMSGSPTDPDLVNRFRHAEDVVLPGYTHFIPMEDPALVALHVEEMIVRVAAGTS
jgi:pimeloyl-ACP methyl ester carboxylesterase